MITKKKKKTKFIGVRLTDDEFNKLKIKSGLYCDGNISDWVAFAITNFQPSKRLLKKGRN